MPFTIIENCWIVTIEWNHCPSFNDFVTIWYDTAYDRKNT